MELKVGQEIGISLFTLYKNGINLNKGYIVNSEDEYFDLYQNNVLVCMDGENAKIIDIKDNVVSLINENDEFPKLFELTTDELDIAVLG